MHVSNDVLIAAWMILSGIGFVMSSINLADSLRVLQWQIHTGINTGTRALLAAGHVRTSALRLIETAAALGIGAAAIVQPHVPGWIGVVCLFTIIIGVCFTSFSDLSDRWRLIATDIEDHHQVTDG